MANQRVQTDAAGQVVLKLKTASRDGTTHLVMAPLDFMEQLKGHCLIAAAAPGYSRAIRAAR